MSAFPGRFGFTALARALAAVGGVAWAAVLGRLAGPAVLGEFFIALALITGANVLSRAGSDTGLMHHVAPRDEDEPTFAILRRALLLSLALSCAFAVVLLLARHAVETFFDGEVLAGMLLGMAPALVPLALCSVLLSFLKARRQPAISALLEMGSVLGTAAVLLLGIHLGFGRIGAIGIGAAFAGGACLCAAAAAWRLRRSLRRSWAGTERRHTVELKAYARDSRVYVVAEAAAFAQQVVGTLLAGLLLSAGELGLLKAAERLAALLGFAQLVSNAVIGPSLAAYQRSGRTRGSTALFRRAAYLSILAGLPLLTLYCLAPSLPLSLFGADFAAAAGLLIILAAGQFVNVACGPVLLLLNLSGHGRDARNIVLISSAAGTLLIWAGAAGFGAIGAAVAIATTMALQNLIASYLAWQRTGVGLLA